MSQRTLLIIFCMITVVAFTIWRFIPRLVVEAGGISAGLVLIAVLFVIGALAAPYLDRSRRDGLD